MTARPFELVVGLPTVARPRDYVERTVGLLLSRGTEELALRRARIVLLNAEEPPEAHRAVETIRQRFGPELERGSLEIVSLPISALPATGPVQEGSAPVEIWQRRQVLHAAALMEYCAPLGSHYLHLEDDVIPAPGYLTRVLRFLDEEGRSGGWHSLAFYSPNPTVHRHSIDPGEFWGFIGILLRSSDLPPLVAEMRRRSGEAPVDLVFTHYLARRGLELRAHSPSLFEHIGLQSSFPGHIQTNRAWRWRGDRTPGGRFLRRVGRGIRVRWLRWSAWMASLRGRGPSVGAHSKSEP